MRLRCGRAALVFVFVLLLGAAPARAGLLEDLLGPPKPPAPKPTPGVDPRYENPVLGGDYPDPSVIRTADGWWAVVSSSGWSPPYSILHSYDLVNWRIAGRVLRRRPGWARGDFWAPELVSWGGRFLVYYAARSRSGEFCVGVATSSRAIGFYHDEGPVVCPPLGAIDPLPVTDEAGRPNLVWKEDGNNHGRPTPIMAAPLSRDGLRLAGPARELFRNSARWEGAVVEAPTITRHDGRFYMLYSARNCCGPNCDYVTGAARSETLYGRWEKHAGPILSNNARFRCPGGGSVVDGRSGRQYLVYHAYSSSEPLMVGRQLLVDRLGWTADGWPIVGDGHGPSLFAASPLRTAQRERRPPVDDGFTGRWLGPAWQWPTDRPRLRLEHRRGGRLLIGPVRAGRRLVPGAAGQQPSAPNYAAEAVVGRRTRGARPGLAVYGELGQQLGIERRRSRLVVWRSGGRRGRVVGRMRAPRSRRLVLRVEVVGGDRFTFKALTRSGWRRLGPAGYRPPFWVPAPRVVLRVAGRRRDRAAFERFRLGASN